MNGIGQDGRAPSAIADDARASVSAYPNARSVSASAVGVQGRIDAFEIQDDQCARWQGRRLVLATGVRDHLPPSRAGRSAGAACLPLPLLPRL